MGPQSAQRQHILRMEYSDLSISCISLVTDLFPAEFYCSYMSVLKAVTGSVMVFLTPRSLFRNPVGKLFSTWRGKIYDRSAHKRTTLPQAMWSCTVHCSSRCWPRKETLKLSWPVKNEQPAVMNDDCSHNILCCDMIVVVSFKAKCVLLCIIDICSLVLTCA